MTGFKKKQKKNRYYFNQQPWETTNMQTINTAYYVQVNKG